MSDKLKDEKELAYYSATINAWINTKMEKDKSILILSSAGIGLLITLLTTIGFNSIWILVFYIITLISFSVTLILEISIFDKNAQYLKSCINDKNDNIKKQIKRLDRFSYISFLIAILFTLFIGLSAGLHGYNKNKENKMAQNESNTLDIPDEGKRSLEGFEDLKPDTNTGNENTNNDSTSSEEGNADSG